MLCVLNVASFNVLTIKENRPLYFIGPDTGHLYAGVKQEIGNREEARGNKRLNKSIVIGLKLMTCL